MSETFYFQPTDTDALGEMFGALEHFQRQFVDRDFVRTLL